MDVLGYRKLVAYTKAKELVVSVYQLMRQFPKEEQFALCNQLRRSAVSITSNIAEGVSRYSYKDKVHFLEISYGSLMEVMSQLEVAYSLDYITKVDLQNAEVLVTSVVQLITNLQYSFMPKDENGKTCRPYRQNVAGTEQTP